MLGLLNPASNADHFDPNDLRIVTSPGSRFPLVSCHDAPNIQVQVIIYDRPNPKSMQYLSLKPIRLALGDKSERAARDLPLSGSNEELEVNERLRRETLLKKLRWHSVISHKATPKEKALPVVIEQINCSSELASLLAKNIGLVGTRMKRSFSVSERVVESASNLRDRLWTSLWSFLTFYIFPVVVGLFKIALLGYRLFAELLLIVVEWRLVPEAAALKDVSATAQQIDIRLQQFCYWPIQYFTLRRRKSTWQSITNSHPEYIRFYNSLWLVANDVIIGFTVGSFIVDNADLIAVYIDRGLSVWTMDGLEGMIAWLTDWPAGLKLNTELARFFGDLLLWVVQYWTSKYHTSNAILHTTF